MTQSSQPDETTRLENSTYNILRALGTDADFLYDTVNTYIKDAQNANRSDLVNLWNTIKTRPTETFADVRTGIGERSKTREINRIIIFLLLTVIH
jgi:hypothetical protein